MEKKTMGSFLAALRRANGRPQKVVAQARPMGEQQK